MSWEARAAISIFVILVGFLVWLPIPKPRSPFFRQYGWLVGIALVTESIGYSLKFWTTSNHWLFNLYILIECGIVLKMIATAVPTWKRVVPLGFMFGMAVMFGSLYYNDWVFNYLLIEGAVSIALMLFILCVMVLWRFAQNTECALYRVPEFWVLFGFVIYFGGMAPYVACLHYLVAHFPDTIVKGLGFIMPMLCVFRYLTGAWGCDLERRLR